MIMLIKHPDVWGDHSESYSEIVIKSYMRRYATLSRLGRNATDVDIARIHNGGPNGWRLGDTLGYWNRISQAMREIESGMTGTCLLNSG